jgi:quercetin dioxygenase-like cupin family protein
MERNAFTRLLAEEGFAQTVLVEREADGVLDTHVHPFEAKALVLAGELVIEIDGTPRSYKAGDIFHLQSHCAHAETYGPQGVTYLVGRK